MNTFKKTGGNMKNILILNAGTRNTLIQYFKKTCGDSLKIIATDSFELAPAIYEADKHYVTKRWNEEGYWDEIDEICEKEHIGLILSLIDPELELLAARKSYYENKGIVVNIGEEEIIKTTFDKFQTLEFLRQHNYPWIKSYTNYENVCEDISVGKVEFPLMTKPCKGSGSAGLEIVHTLERLKEVCEENSDIIIQEFVNGQELGVDVFVDLISGEIISMFAKKKLKMRSGETDKSVSYKNDKLFALISHFVKEFGLRGVNDIDVFEKDGEFYISEVNPRFGGGYLHAYASGVDFPGYLLNNLNGIANTPNVGNYEEGIYMMKYFAITVKEEKDLH